MARRERASLRRAGPLLAGALALIVLALLARALLRDPRIVLLTPARGAHWIRLDEPFLLTARPNGRMRAVFRVRFDVREVPAQAPLSFRALRGARVSLDGAPLPVPARDFRAWKEPVSVDLAPRLSAGPHELAFEVENENGHPALIARCDALGLASGAGWEASADGTRFAPALRVDAPQRPALARSVAPARAFVARAAPWLAPLFALCFACSAFGGRLGAARFRLSASALRFGLLAAWALLAANNLYALPPGLGFDLLAHLEYVRYVAERLALPYADEGWQMFQAPLFYVLDAPVYALVSRLAPSFVEQALRVLPLACGALQVEIAYRFMRGALPEREDLQRVGVLTSGLLPMNLYMSQGVGNEPLSGVLSASVLLLCASALRVGSDAPDARRVFALGGVLGLALLAKASAWLLAPLAVCSVAGAAWLRGERGLRSAAPAAQVGAIALAVGGWFYLRNQLRFGQAVIGGWDPLTGIGWWQDPSFRIPEHFVRFGEALVQPVYAATAGIWDALYASFWLDGTLSSAVEIPPPWNYTFVISCAWLGLPVSAAIAAGMVVPLGGSAQRTRALALAAVALYLAAQLWLYLTLPVYSTAKATYALGLTPVFGFLAAVGVSPLLRQRWLRAFVHAWLICLGVSAYLGYFVVSGQG